MLRPKQIEARARELLRQSGAEGPPVPIQKVAHALGAIIRAEPFRGESEISGALYRMGGEVPVIGVNKLDAPVRRRFTIAHEIGHLVLHADTLHLDPGHQVGVVLDQAAARPTLRFLRDRVSSEATDHREIEANRFAASLLMPEDLLAIDVKRCHLPVSVQELQRLAKRYQVSQQAITFRLMNLGVPMQTM